MAGLRVVVDMSAYFTDHRQKSLIYINRDCIKSVEHFVFHICKVFNLQDEFEIFIADAHVPRSESADIIQEGDVLRIQKVIHQPDVSGTSLHCETSKNDDEGIPSINSSPPSRKKKKRKAAKSEMVEDEKLTEENASETQSSCVALSLEPRKKRKKTPPTNSEDYSSKATCDSQMWKSESRKGKKKLDGAGDTQEWSHYHAAEGDVVNRINNLKDVFSTETNPSNEAGNVHKSTRISKCYHLGKEKEETNAVEGLNSLEYVSQEYGGEMSSTLSSVLDEIADNTKVATSSLCETIDSNIGSSSARKRHRPRRRRQKKRKNAKTPPFCEPIVPVCEPSRVVVLKRMKDIVNNCHVRFPEDEDDENMDETTEVLDTSQSVELSSSCSNGIIRDGGSSELKDLEISKVSDAGECLAAEHVADNKCPLSKSDAECVDHPNDQQMSKGEDITKPDLSVGKAGNGMSEKVNGESVVNDSVVLKMDNCNDNAACDKEVSSEDRQSKPENKPSVVNPQGRGSRRRNVIVAMGLGATLSHLIKESKLPDEEESVPQKITASEPLQTLVKKDDLNPKPVKTPKDRRYGGFPVLEKFPRKGDILAFKVLKLSASYEPIVSGYLEGKIINCDDASTLVTVEVLSGAEELKKFRGKFDVEEEDEDKTVASGKKNELKRLELKWSEFIEPRLVFP